MLRQPPATTAPAPTGGVVLDKQQLKATLLELIEVRGGVTDQLTSTVATDCLYSSWSPSGLCQQDDAFIETLHGAYLARLRRGSPRAEEQGGQQADA